MRPLVRLALVPALLVGGFAVAGGAHQHGTTLPAAPPPAASPANPGPAASIDPSFDARMARAMERMHAAMAAVPTTGQPDRDFLAAMVPHHQGAIDMAEAVLLVTKDPRIRNLAQSIITEQRYEIELMKTLLAAPAEPAAPAQPAAPAEPAAPAANTLSHTETKP